MKHLLGALLFALIPLMSSAQNAAPEPYAKEWAQADSFLIQDLPESARTIVQRVYARATSRGEEVARLKAQLYLMAIAQQTDEAADSTAIAAAEAEARTAAFPYNAVWQSIAAQLYWNYYGSNRWKILQRTATAEAAGDDFEQWDARRFVERTSGLYLQSLSQAEELKAVRIEMLAPVLDTGTATRGLRPTLYDLLAFRALEFFENEEKDLSRPAYHFVMDDLVAFAPAAEFARKDFPSRDTASLHRQALLIYGDLLRLHAADAAPDARIDADLHRLDFAHRTSVLADKKALYKAALERIVQAHRSHPLSALAEYRAVMLDYEAEAQPYNDGDGNGESTDTGRDLRAQRTALERIIARFPAAEGGILAAQALQNLTAPVLSVETEETVLPGVASKALLVFKNTAKVYIRVIPLKDETYRGDTRYNDEAYIKMLVGTKAVQTFSVDLPGSEDLALHRTEVKVDALPTGLYAVLYSLREDFRLEDNLFGYAPFQATRLAVVTQQSEDPDRPAGYVLDRKTGNPVGSAALTFYNQRWNSKSNRYDYTAAQSATSRADGSFALPAGDRGYYGFRITSGEDRFLSGEYLSHYRYRYTPRPETKVFFFTDRSIYRPGQTVYYKGILLRQTAQGRKAEVLKSMAVEVTFYDANSQKVATEKLTTNDYGSFTGTFTAPTGGLTGSMTIQATTGGQAVGSTSVSVEEYKRPKFKVEWDTLKGEYALAETVTVRGKAASYSGAVVDGATVKYRVVRETFWPFYWYHWRWGGVRSSSPVEILQGTATTDASGAFTVSFQTLPDLTQNKQALPAFSYTVYADVTDINGETRSGSQTVRAGYRSLQFAADIPERASASIVDTLSITTHNLSGEFVAARVSLKISHLRTPDTLYRARLWKAPDVQLYSEAEFRRYFPLDEYKTEADHRTWAPDAVAHEASFQSTRDGRVAVPTRALTRNGWYLVEMRAADRAGRPVEEKRYMHVWAGSSGGRVAEPLVVTDPGAQKEPGNDARVDVATGFREAVLLQTESTMEGEGTTTRTVLRSDRPAAWNRPVTEADRGGIALSYFLLKDNRAYKADAVISVPWSNKDLSVEWETHRDKLQPGEPETWTLVVRGPKKDKVAAEVAATLYDASLDAFKPHNWYDLEGLYPGLYNRTDWSASHGFGTETGRPLTYLAYHGLPGYAKEYDQLIVLSEGGDYRGYRQNYRSGGGAVMRKMRVPSPAQPSARASDRESSGVAGFADTILNEDGVTGQITQKLEARNVAFAPPPPPGPNDPADVPLRKNLQETAFFFPQLRTDADGSVRLSFTLPEALTEWKFMAVAHTPDMKTGTLTGSVKTQKDLMVVPGLPRFFRQGDNLVLSAKISNLTDQALSGAASLEILDAQTMRPLALPFALAESNTAFSAPAGGSGTATWTLRVPQSLYVPVLVRIRAKSGAFTDGEENALPVITNRMLVTETMPLWMTGPGTKTLTLEKLLATAPSSNNPPTLSHHALTLEYTANPAWYAVQALPYLMEYPYECSEQTFNRYYAAALAAHIVEKAPRVKEIFRRWETLDTAALQSNLEKNEELKSALLEETPWVLEAQSETEQKHRIALLFQSAKLSRDLDKAARKLEDMLLPEGGFPWFKGDSRPDRYITQYIATGMGRLHHLGVRDKGGRIDGMMARILPYLDRKIGEDYARLLKEKPVDTAAQRIGAFEAQYLYLRSFYPDRAVEAKHSKAVAYYTRQAAKYWPGFNPYTKSMIALALHRGGDKKVVPAILQSLRETAKSREEIGMWWMETGRSWWWHEAPVEAQAQIIEAFSEASKDVSTIDAARRWLLKQKQTQNWSTTRATADACYALLLQGTQWLTADPEVTVTLGEKTIRSADLGQQAGTGYFKTRIPGAEVSPGMGTVTLTVSEAVGQAGAGSYPLQGGAGGGAPSYGAVYWQYFEDLDKITAASTPLVVRKELFIERATDRGLLLEKISDGAALKVGNKVKARIEIIVDSDMEYVHLKDARASCFEPVNVLSGYRYQGGLGYYESTRDVSSNFFISYLPKGKYVFEYPMFVTHSGNFSAGLATIQCMYAPEFSAHSAGVRVEVK